MTFSDEKIFTVDTVLNRRAKPKAEVKGTFRTKHPAQVMAFGVVASDRKTMPIKFYKRGDKINIDTYYKTLRYNVLRWLKANYPDGNYLWTQDGARPTQLEKYKFSANPTLVIFGNQVYGRPLAQI